MWRTTSYDHQTFSDSIERFNAEVTVLENANNERVQWVVDFKQIHVHKRMCLSSTTPRNFKINHILRAKTTPNNTAYLTEVDSYMQCDSILMIIKDI